MTPNQVRNDASSGQPDVEAAAALIKRIRKLRWIGMTDEAEALQHRLKQLPTQPADCVLAAAGETD